MTEATEIIIICTAESHNSPRTVGRFKRDADGWGLKMTRLHGVDQLPPRWETIVTLGDDDAVQYPTWDGTPWPEVGRRRYNFKCGCTDAVSVGHEKLTPILDTLAAADVPSISLTELRASIRGK